ncbi:MAG: low molecular weight phosphotyrosine protein phosphatase [Treponema sp.]|nr:low molecular weight phosphotyrosine protein phosphatase [Treponema sp.]
MTRILFICHGNICRSPMAQCIMQQIVDNAGASDRFFIDSKATSTEEIGNEIYPPAKRKLNEMNVPLIPHHASQIKKSDYENFDLLIGMDDENIRNMKRIFGVDTEAKIHKIREFSGSHGDVADPWFTGNFDITYNQISTACHDLFKDLESR